MQNKTKEKIPWGSKKLIKFATDLFLRWKITGKPSKSWEYVHLGHEYLSHCRYMSMSLYQIRKEMGEYKRGVRKREEEGYNLCRYEANIYTFYL